MSGLKVIYLLNKLDHYYENFYNNKNYTSKYKNLVL